MSDFKCHHCSLILTSKQMLEKHLAKKNKCYDAPFKCADCKKTFQRKDSFVNHKQYNCPGPQKSKAEKDQEIEDLKTILAASSALKKDLAESSNNINIAGRDLHIGDVNNIQVNINVLPCSEENVEHLRGLDMKQLREKIGLNPSPSTMIELFKLVRLDEDHPENHNLLLASPDSKTVHYFCEGGWKTGTFDERVRFAIDDDKRNLSRWIRERDRDNEFYWGYLVHDVGTKIGHMDDYGLKPIYDGVRAPLHASTMRLAAKYGTLDTTEASPGNREHAMEAELKLQQELTRQQQELTRQQQERNRNVELETRKLELELEIMKMRSAMTRTLE